MPGTIVLPRQQNPWEQMLPQMVQAMVLGKMQQKYQEEAETRAEERRKVFQAGERAYQGGLRQEQAGMHGFTSVGPRDYSDVGGALGQQHMDIGGQVFKRPQEELITTPVGGTNVIQLKRGGETKQMTTAAPGKLNLLDYGLVTVGDRLVQLGKNKAGNLSVTEVLGSAKEWGDPITAKENDGANLPAGTVYIKSKKDNKTQILSKAPGEYTLQQQIDDTRQYHSLRLKTLQDQFGIISGKEKEYDQVMTDLSKDLQAIRKGESPSYMKEKKQTRKVVRTGRDKSGRKVVQYDDGSIEYAD